MQRRRLSSAKPKIEWFHPGKIDSTDKHIQLVGEIHAKMTDSGPLHLAVEVPHNKLKTVNYFRKQARSPIQELFQ